MWKGIERIEICGRESKGVRWILMVLSSSTYEYMFTLVLSSTTLVLGSKVLFALITISRFPLGVFCLRRRRFFFSLFTIYFR